MDDLKMIQDNEFEKWKPINGAPEYFVSTLGRVYSFKQKTMFLGDRFSKKGYPTVVLYTANRKINIPVHRLVANAFVDNAGNKPHINHKNGIKVDNHHKNLEFVTPKENFNHAEKTGLIARPQGTECYQSKFTAEEIREIRQMAMSGKSCRGIARLKGTDHGTIGKIVKRQSYRNI